MTLELRRDAILPEPELPDSGALMAEGRALAGKFRVGPSPFLKSHGVGSEAEYKRARAAQGAIMLHAHIGFRAFEKSRRAYAEIHERLDAAGFRVDRYGICFDFNMGYPAAKRKQMPRGTGMILEDPEQFVALTGSAPVAAHFGDWVLGTPASVENAAAALAAGATSIGNMGQYFTFELPHERDDVARTAETIKALAMVAAQPVEVIVHSNLCDGYGALFCDLACVLGWVLIEQHVIEELIGARLAHCFGQTFSDPLTRLAFQRALADLESTPGTMIFGNTTSYRGPRVANYATLASYFLVDIHGQKTRPTGHAINPVPVSEAERIPEIDEIVDAHLVANRLIERSAALRPLFDTTRADQIAARIGHGARRFKDAVLAGLDTAGIDTGDPFEVLLSLRRIGPKRLEERFGPGQVKPGELRGRRPMVKATTLAEVERRAQDEAAALEPGLSRAIREAGLKGCVATTDVHEYGKVLIDTALGALGVELIDGGVTTEPAALVARARDQGADFIAVSTYNGVALSYHAELRRHMEALGLDLPIFIGGKLNEVPEASNTSLPVDVSADLAAAGAVPCPDLGAMWAGLAALAQGAGARGEGRKGPAPSTREAVLPRILKGH